MATQEGKGCHVLTGRCKLREERTQQLRSPAAAPEEQPAEEAAAAAAAAAAACKGQVGEGRTAQDRPALTRNTSSQKGKIRRPALKAFLNAQRLFGFSWPRAAEQEAQLSVRASHRATPRGCGSRGGRSSGGGPTTGGRGRCRSGSCRWHRAGSGGVQCFQDTRAAGPAGCRCLAVGCSKCQGVPASPALHI